MGDKVIGRDQEFPQRGPLACVERLRRRAVPPNWSPEEWKVEVEQIASLGALKAAAGDAVGDGSGPKGELAPVVLKRADETVRAAWRREWAFGLRSLPLLLDGPSDRPGGPTEEENPTASCEPLSEPAEIYYELHDAIAKLPAWLRDVIVQLFLDGRTESEVGEALRLPQYTVSRRKQAALKRLRVVLAS